MTGKTIVLGVDVGKLHDPTAVCACEWTEVVVKPADPLFGEHPIMETHYRVLGAERLPLGTSYPDVAKRINALARRLYERDSAGQYHCLIDATGVGGPVVDMVRAAIIPQCHVTAVTITGGDKGDASIIWRTAGSIGKSYLVSRLQSLLQSGRLVAPRNTDMEAMAEELKVYEIRTRDTGTPEMGAFAVGTHDDLVTALALSCIADEQRVRYGPDVDGLPSPPL